MFDAYGVFPSRARFDGTSPHETRPGDGVCAVVYEPNGDTRIVRVDMTLRATGYGRRARLVMFR